MKKQINEELIPRYYELEDFRRSVNRKVWVVIGCLGSVSLLSLMLAFLVIAKPTPVIAFDAQGRPLLFEDTISPRLKLEEVRINYFVEQFLQKYAGIDSSNLDRDLRDALNMMTDRLREVAKNDKAELERRTKFQDSNVRSHFEDLQIKIAPYDAEESKEIYVIAWGKIVFEPRVGVVPESDRVVQWVFSQVVLRREPISKTAIHGVRVDFARSQFFSSEEDLRLERLKRKP